MFDEFYFWTKNRHPNPSKNHSRNAYCRFFTSYLKTEGIIVKTFHLDPQDGLFGTRETDIQQFDQDLIPFVKYSLNKKKRWEARGSRQLLIDLKKTYNKLDVFVMGRVCLRSSPYFYPASPHERLWKFFQLFPIREIHQLQDDQNHYTCISTKSICGQSFDSLQPENRFSVKPRKWKNRNFRDSKPSSAAKPIVAYHIITPPRNYETLRNNDFRFTSCNKIVHKRRCTRMKDILLELRYEELEDSEDELEFGSEEVSSLEASYAPKKVYDWKHHIRYCRPNFGWRIRL